MDRREKVTSDHLLSLPSTVGAHAREAVLVSARLPVHMPMTDFQGWSPSVGNLIGSKALEHPVLFGVYGLESLFSVDRFGCTLSFGDES
eukprot:4398028-Amphidinium_carterae.1